MNVIVTTILLVCVIAHMLISPSTLLSSMISGASTGVEVILSLVPIYVVWNALVLILVKCGLDRWASRLLSPILNRLFRGESEEVKGLIALNLSCNILGMGSGATPLGIRAISLMDDGSDRTTRHQRLFTLLNTSSIAILPTTVISILTSHGSASPESVILPTLIVSVTCCILTTLIGSVGR